MRPKYTFVIAGLLTALAPVAAQAQQSASYKLERLTLAAGAARLTSASYVNSITLSELIGSAAHCPTGSAVSLGFWSFLGVGDPSIVLRLAKDPIVPGRIDLSWTGQAPGFRLYRSPSSADVAASQNLLLSTAACAAVDATAPALAFYLVRAVGGP
jgi:hypothetical protein